MSSGVTGAGPIFHAVMLAAERRAVATADDVGASDIVSRDADMPVRTGEICALSGMAANPWCPSRRSEWVATDRETLPCSWHHLADEGLLTVWPAEFRQWARESGVQGSRVQVSGVQGPEVHRVNQVRAEPGPFLRISNPPDGATYLIDPTMRSEFQALTLRAVRSARGPVEWTVDGKALGTADSEQAMTWPLARGRHTFVLRDANGHVAAATIVVR
jgi:membrane carboxypeptidase/penicillin-binding protein PbpC